MRVAVIHDWLISYAGAERVLEQILKIYPQADLFAVCDFVGSGQREFLNGRDPYTTFIQHLPWAKKLYRTYLPLMPLAIEQLDLDGYDTVISSSHAVAKGVLVGPDQLHVSYVHSPMRYAWDMQHRYMRLSGAGRGVRGWALRWLLHRMRVWDAVAANRVDLFLANSQFVARRIRKAYRRDAQVLYPPVDVDGFSISTGNKECYCTASRLVAYKQVALIVEAFAQMPTRHLKVIGDGPDRRKIEKLAAKHPNVEVLGYQDSSTLAKSMAEAKAFVFAAEEDFGILPVEAQACGTPVIAYRRGGASETVKHGVTGILFETQDVESIIAAVDEFECGIWRWDPHRIRNNALEFGISRFKREFESTVEQAWQACRQ